MLGVVTPLTLFGSRAITLVAIFIVIFSVFRILRLPKLFFFTAGLFSLFFTISGYEQILTLAADNSDFLSLIGSQRDLAGITDITLNSLSSGRLQIIEAYVTSFDMWQFVFGRGGISPAIGFSTHNDFLDVLFFFGVPALFLFLKFYWHSVLRPLTGTGLITMITILIIGTFNPVFTSATIIYFLLLVSYIDKKEKCADII